MSTPDTATPETQKKPIWKQKWFWITVGALLIVSAISNAINGSSGRSKDAAPSASVAITSPSVLPSTPEATSKASEPAAPSSEPATPAVPVEVAPVSSPATAEARWLEMHDVTSPLDFVSKPGYENNLNNPLYAIHPGWGGSVDGYLEIRVQEKLTKESVKRLGINVLNFIGPEYPGIDGIIFTDSNGIDHNFFRSSAPLANRK